MGNKVDTFIPSTPRSLRVTAQDVSSISLTWDPPRSDGGSSVHSYLLEARRNGRALEKSFMLYGDIRAGTIRGLTPNERYDVRLYAENAKGRSAGYGCVGNVRTLAEPHRTHTRLGKPSAPVNLSEADAGCESLSVTWLPPESEGGSPILSYSIDVRTAGEEYRREGVADSSARLHTVAKLKPSTHYDVRVFAENARGKSLPAELCGILTLDTNRGLLGSISEECSMPSHVCLGGCAVSHDVESASLQVSPHALNDVRKPSSPNRPKTECLESDAISIQWDPPDSDGGSPVTKYIIQARLNPSDVTTGKVDGRTLFFSFRDLQAGQFYDIFVYAVNARGLSDPAQLARVKVIYAPHPPANVHVTEVGPESLSVEWSPYDVGCGTPVSRYLVEARVRSGGDPEEDEEDEEYQVVQQTVAGESNTCVIHNLTVGRDYNVRVWAENIAGRSFDSTDLSDVRTYDVPRNPRDVRLHDVSHGTFCVEWDAPEFDGGSDITAYDIKVSRLNPESPGRLGDGKKTVGKDTRVHCVQNLVGGNYCLLIWAVNKAGPSREPTALEIFDVPPAKVDDLPHYPMHSRPRGMCLIVSNEKFPTGTRDGAEHDRENLQRFLKTQHFMVDVRTNMKKQELIDCVLRIARLPDHEAYDCFVCCISSHGSSDGIWCSDGEYVKVNDIMDLFKPVYCPGLAGKPKLFFINMCRGTNTQEAVDVYDEATPGYTSLIPNDADFLVGWSTTEGTKSWRERSSGSWYFSTLVEMMEKHAARHDLLSILTKVNEEVAKLGDEYQKQCPAPNTTLRKKVYF